MFTRNEPKHRKVFSSHPISLCQYTRAYNQRMT